MTEAAPTGRLAHTLRALRHRNYRLYLSGQIVSLMGTWMTRLALSWLTYRLTHSAFLLGLVGFAGQILTFLLAPFAGVWVDRIDRRWLLIATQAVSAMQSLALAALTLAGVITIHEILALAALQGLIDAFDMPARQSFVTRMVPDKADLGNAIALNSSTVNVARLVGPPVAAVVIARLGEGWCFGIDGVSYFAVIASLWMMTVPQDPPLGQHRTPMVEQLHDGWGYVSRFVPVRNILLLFASTSLLGVSQMALMPVFAAQILHGGPHLLGWLTTASAAGGLMGAVFLASRKSPLGLLRKIKVGSAMFGAAMIAFGLSHWAAASLLVLPFSGFGMMMGLAGSNTVIQTLSPEAKRGRVMSFYTMAFIGMMPFGSLLAGALASRIGAPQTLLVSGVCVLLMSLWFYLQEARMKHEMRPRYVELGILPPIQEAA